MGSRGGGDEKKHAADGLIIRGRVGVGKWLPKQQQSNNATVFAEGGSGAGMWKRDSIPDGRIGDASGGLYPLPHVGENRGINAMHGGEDTFKGRHDIGGREVSPDSTTPQQILKVETAGRKRGLGGKKAGLFSESMFGRPFCHTGTVEQEAVAVVDTRQPILAYPVHNDLFGYAEGLRDLYDVQVHGWEEIEESV